MNNPLVSHKFAGYQVLLLRPDRQFMITVLDPAGKLADQFVDVGEADDEAALQFEQVVYNLHIANDDEEYRLPLFDFASEEQFEVEAQLITG